MHEYSESSECAPKVGVSPKQPTQKLALTFVLHVCRNYCMHYWMTFVPERPSESQAAKSRPRNTKGNPPKKQAAPVKQQDCLMWKRRTDDVKGELCSRGGGVFTSRRPQGWSIPTWRTRSFCRWKRHWNRSYHYVSAADWTFGFVWNWTTILSPWTVIWGSFSSQDQLSGYLNSVNEGRSR